jgi:ribosomal protein S8
MLQLQNFISILNLTIKANNFFFYCNKTEFILKIVKLLIKHNYFVGFKIAPLDKNKIMVFLKLNFERSRPLFTTCKLISSCSRPVYVKYNKWSSNTSSLLVLSTSRGLVTQKEALSHRLGGLLLFKII